MTSDQVFDLTKIIQESISELKEFKDVYSYLIEISEDKLATRRTDSVIKEIAGELVSRLFKSVDNED